MRCLGKVRLDPRRSIGSRPRMPHLGVLAGGELQDRCVVIPRLVRLHLPELYTSDLELLLRAEAALLLQAPLLLEHGQLLHLLGQLRARQVQLTLGVPLPLGALGVLFGGALPGGPRDDELLAERRGFVLRLLLLLQCPLLELLLLHRELIGLPLLGRALLLEHGAQPLISLILLERRELGGRQRHDRVRRELHTDLVVHDAHDGALRAVLHIG
mmetsp:Transcript_29291/g.84930  ORF Transcript_29291/g.84930 Transcript_29291/m.84930 type:complete len:214 (-) Transcript_29291:3452-4093(-)